MKNTRLLALSLLCVPVLSSCSQIFTFKSVTAGLLATSSGIFARTDVNLKEKNYAAADYLVQSMSKSVKPYQIILAEPLVELDNPEISSPLGSNITEGIGLRFSHLGYNVWLHKVATKGNESLYHPPPKGMKEDFVLKGTYIRGRDGVDVFLRIINVKSSQVVSAFDYKLPLSREVRDLSKTQTRIYRVSP